MGERAMSSEAGALGDHWGRDDLVVRHHPLLLVARGWGAALLLLAGATAIVALATWPERVADAVSAGVLAVAAIVFLAGAAWGLGVYLGWANDLIQLTEHRLVLRSGLPGLNEARRELRFERIESVELDLGNPLMRWGGCADLIIAVAGGPPLRFAAARAPVAVRDHIAAHLRERAAARLADEDAAIRASVERLVVADDTPLLPEVARARRAATRRRSARGHPLRYFGKRIEGEVWQRHRWFLARAALAPLALLVVAGALPFALDWLGVPELQRAVGVATLVGVVAALLWLAWAWGNWRNDYYVVTPERLIAIDQLPLGLRQQINEASLDKVQDIGYRVPHPWALLLDYGDVTVSTASDSQAFVLRGIARPRQLAEEIDRHVAARQLAGQHAQHDALRAEFARWLTAYDGVRNAE